MFEPASGEIYQVIVLRTYGRKLKEREHLQKLVGRELWKGSDDGWSHKGRAERLEGKFTTKGRQERATPTRSIEVVTFLIHLILRGIIIPSTLRFSIV